MHLPALAFDYFIMQQNFVSRHQRNKLKLDDVPKLPEWQRLRLQHCSNDMSVPNLVIRRASVVQGHGDIFQRKNSGGKIYIFKYFLFFGKDIWTKCLFKDSLLSVFRMDLLLCPYNMNNSDNCHLFFIFQ